MGKGSPVSRTQKEQVMGLKVMIKVKLVIFLMKPKVNLATHPSYLLPPGWMASKLVMNVKVMKKWILNL